MRPRCRRWRRTNFISARIWQFLQIIFPDGFSGVEARHWDRQLYERNWHNWLNRVSAANEESVHVLSESVSKMFSCLLVRHNEGNQEQADMHSVDQTYTDHLHEKVDKQCQGNRYVEGWKWNGVSYSWRTVDMSWIWSVTATNKDIRAKEEKESEADKNSMNVNHLMGFRQRDIGEQCHKVYLPWKRRLSVCRTQTLHG